MGTYTIEEVVKRWRRGEVTSEQAIGQLLQIVGELNRRLGALEKRVFNGSSSKATGSGNK